MGITHTSGLAFESDESACVDAPTSEDNIASSLPSTEPRPTLLGLSRNAQPQKHSGILASKSHHRGDMATEDPQPTRHGMSKRRTAVCSCLVGLNLVGMSLLISAIVIFFMEFDRIKSFHVERDQEKSDSPLPPALVGSDFQLDSPLPPKPDFQLESSLPSALVESDACPAVCQQTGLEWDPGACTFGRECVFGHGW